MGQVTVLFRPTWAEEPAIIANFINAGKTLKDVYDVKPKASAIISMSVVDKILINYNFERIN